MSNHAYDLARSILNSLNDEFSEKKITGNLLDNTYVIETPDYTEIHILAPSYDFYEYFINGVIMPPKKGGLPLSYADLLDAYGSRFTIYWETPAKSRSGKITPGRGNIHKMEKYPKNHIGYVDRVIAEGIQNWIDEKNIKVLKKDE